MYHDITFGYVDKTCHICGEIYNGYDSGSHECPPGALEKYRADIRKTVEKFDEEVRTGKRKAPEDMTPEELLKSLTGEDSVEEEDGDDSNCVRWATEEEITEHVQDEIKRLDDCQKREEEAQVKKSEPSSEEGPDSIRIVDKDLI